MTTYTVTFTGLTTDHLAALRMALDREYQHIRSLTNHMTAAELDEMSNDITDLQAQMQAQYPKG